MSKIAFVFPGQGSQFVGMGRTLYEQHAVAREVFEEANKVLGFDLIDLCFNGDIEELTKTENAQAAILTHSVAAFKVFTLENGIEPTYLLGHSLGEISALTCTGAIDFKDAVQMVYQRGKFMQEAAAEGIGSMMSIQNIDITIVQQECERASIDGKVAVISNYNSPNQVVISGHSEAINLVVERLSAYEGFIIPLKVSAPFHSPLMNGAVHKFEKELSKYQFSNLKWPVISNVSAEPYIGTNDIIRNLSNQIVSAVKWLDSIEYIQEQDVTCVIELGPGKKLRNIIKNCTSTIKAFSYDIKEDRELLDQDLKKIEETTLELKQKNLTTIIEKCLAVAVCTKNHNLSHEQYQMEAIPSYQNLKSMLMMHEQESRHYFTINDVNMAVQMLQSIFTTKQTPFNERNSRLHKINQDAIEKGISLELKE